MKHNFFLKCGNRTHCSFHTGIGSSPPQQEKPGKGNKQFGASAQRKSDGF